jgi:hypothetical protein
MAAKEYRPKEYYPLPVEYLEDDEALDLYSKELNPFLLGAIEPDMDTDDLRKAKEVKEETKAIYRRVSSAIVSTLEKK